MKLGTKVLLVFAVVTAGLAYVFTAFRKLVDAIAALIDQLPSSEEVEAAFGGVVIELSQEPASREIEEYWIARKATAQDMALAVEAHLKVPIIGTFTTMKAFDYLHNVYTETTVGDVWGAGVASFNPVDQWRALGRWAFGSTSWSAATEMDSSRRIWDSNDYIPAKNWATAQLEAFTAWAETWGKEGGDEGPSGEA